MSDGASYLSHPGRWAIGIVVSIVSALVFIAMTRQPVDVELAVIDRGAVRSTILEQGRTRIREVFIISSPLTARVLRVSVEPGDRVQRGEPIARLVGLASGFLDPRGEEQLRAELLAVEARRAAADLERDSLSRELARIEALATARLVSDSERDRARSRWQVADAGARAASADELRVKGALSKAGSEGDTTPIIVQAPVEGVVLAVMQKSETALPAGAPLVSLGDPNLVDVVVELLSQEAVQVRVGDRASIENWGGVTSASTPLAAIVDRIEPIAYTKVSALGIEEQRTRIILKFSDPVPAPLRAHGYRVDVQIVVDELRDVVRVPLGALYREEAGWFVYTEREGQARRQLVNVGLRDERFAEVRDGLHAGEQVIVFPSSEVYDGVRVRSRR